MPLFARMMYNALVWKERQRARQVIGTDAKGAKPSQAGNRWQNTGQIVAGHYKRENMIVGDDGEPYLIDFQISLALTNRWPDTTAAGQALLRLLQRSEQAAEHLASVDLELQELTAADTRLQTRLAAERQTLTETRGKDVDHDLRRRRRVRLHTSILSASFFFPVVCSC